MASLKRMMDGKGVRGIVAAMVAAFAMAPAAGAQTIPNAEILRTKIVVPAINGNAGHVAANSNGDAIYVSQGDNTAYWLPRGSSTPIALLTGLSGGRNAYVDPATNNAYIPSNYSGKIVEIPYVNGSYATGSALGSLSACTSITPTTPCVQFGNGGAALSYYYQPTDVAFDAQGNAYMSDYYSNSYSGGSAIVNSIVQWTPVNGSYTATVVATGITTHTQGAQIAVDAAGDIYYADGTNLYFVSSTTVQAKGKPTLPTAITGFANPVGVSVDQFGNLFVTDSSTGTNEIWEYPAVNGVAQINNPPFVFDPVYSANGVGFDGLGDMFYTGYANSATNLIEATFNAFNLGSAPVGTAASGTNTTLTVQFITAQTVAKLALTPQSVSSGFTYTAGTCAAGSYTAGQSCTFSVNYTPTSVGLQRGALVLTNASGGVIAEAVLSGIGQGPVETNDPGTVSALGSNYSAPTAVAVDSANNVFVADAGKNAVYEYVGGTGTPVSIGSGLSKPSGVAVDSAGNVYIADAGNGEVVEVPAIAGVLTTSAQSTVISGLGSMLGLAADPYGNLYVSDTNADLVYKLGMINGADNGGQRTMISYAGQQQPYAMTTDSAGDLFIADLKANTVTEVTHYGTNRLTIGSGFSGPSGLATDASNSLYVADPGNLRVVKIPYEAPIYNSNDQYVVGPPFSLSAGLTLPYAVALDSAANLYVVDNQNAKVLFVNREQGTLNLGTTNVNTTTSAQNAYIGNAGNTSLSFATPQYSTTSNSAFTITSPSTAGCTGGISLQPSFACILQATFTPSATQTYTQLLSFASNALNTGTPSLTLVGTGANLATTTLSLKQTSPSGIPAYGQTVTVAATISSSTSGTPSGYMEFYVNGQFYSVERVTSATTTVNIVGMLGGQNVIAATYTGDNTFAASTTTLTITVVKAGSTVTVTGGGGGVFQNPVSAVAGTPVTLTATIVPNANAQPTGTVQFSAAGQNIGGPAPVTRTTSGTFIATTVASNLPTGTNQIVAAYSGDVNYATSVGTLTVVIGPQTFTFTPATQMVTMGTHATAVANLQAVSLSGFGPATFVLSCTGLPANTNCGFDPNDFILQPNNQLTLATPDPSNPNGPPLVPETFGPINVQMVINTGTTPVVTPPVQTGSLLHWNGPGKSVPVSLALLGLIPAGMIFRRRPRGKLRRMGTLLTMIVLLGLSVTSFTGCGNSVIGVTPPGTYQVLVTATTTIVTPNATAPPSPSPYDSSICSSSAITVGTSTSVYTICKQTAHVTLVVQ